MTRAPAAPPSVEPPLAPRPLVPTARQVAVGETIAVPAPALPRPEEPGSGGGALRTYLSQFDIRRVRGPRLPIFIFLALAFVGQLTDLLFTVIAPDLQTSFAAGPAAIGAITLLISVLQYLIMPFYGWLVDRVRRVWLLRVSRIFGNLLYTGAAFAGSIPELVSCTASGSLLGLGAQTPAQTLMADYYEEETLGTLLTTLPAFATLATVIGTPLLGLLVTATNWRIGVLAFGCTATGVGLTTLFLREPGRGEAERRELGAETRPEQPPLSFTESWRAARSVHTLRRVWYATPFQVATSTLTTLVALAYFFSAVYGLTDLERSLVTGLMGVAALVGLLATGPIAGRRLATSPGSLLVGCAGLMLLEAAAMVAIALSPTVVVAIVATVPLAFAVAAVPPLVQMVTLKVVPPRMRGLGISTVAPWQLVGVGLFYLAFSVGAAAGGRAMVASLIPLHIIGAVLFVVASGGVARDIKNARASVLAESAHLEAGQTGTAKLLVCRGVEAGYLGTQVLFGVDLDVEDGEIVALLGTNGAGKSTLLNAIAGVHGASGGAILVDGRDITPEPAHANAARGIALMPGGRAVFPELTVAENLAAAAWRLRGNRSAMEASREQALQYFPVLRERLHQRTGDLSGGEQQMVGLAQAFIGKPRLLLIDELTLGLAPAVVSQLLTTLEEIHRRGTTVILVEQSVNVALRIAPRAVFMEKGVVRFDGPTAELLAQPDLVRSIYIGGAVTARRTAAPSRQPAARGEDRPAALEARGLSLDYGGVRAIDDVSLRVEAAEVVGVIGPNGAGKTSLFDVISGFARPRAGSVLVDGRDVFRMSPDGRARLGLGRSFQDARLFPALTTRDNIAVALERRTVRNEAMSAFWLPNVRRSEARIRRRVDGLIDILGLGAFADKFVRELSTGSRRAVEIACIMAAEPRVLLLDEPSSGLAQAETEALGPVLRRLVRDTGCGLLVIEHDMPLVTAVADRLVALELGQVIAAGTPEDVLADERVIGAYLAAGGPAEASLQALAMAGAGVREGSE